MPGNMGKTGSFHVDGASKLWNELPFGAGVKRKCSPFLEDGFCGTSSSEMETDQPHHGKRFCVDDGSSGKFMSSQVEPVSMDFDVPASPSTLYSHMVAGPYSGAQVASVSSVGWPSTSISDPVNQTTDVDRQKSFLFNQDYCRNSSPVTLTSSSSPRRCFCRPGWDERFSKLPTPDDFC